jgi:hypothetical protein
MAAGLLALVVLGAPPVARANPLPPPDVQASFNDLTDVREFELTVEDARLPRVTDLLVTLKGGYAAWELVDPAGEVRMTGEGEQGRIRSISKMETPGTWVLRLSLEHATGTYDVRWLTEPEPEAGTIRFGASRRSAKRCTT